MGNTEDGKPEDPCVAVDCPETARQSCPRRWMRARLENLLSEFPEDGAAAESGDAAFESLRSFEKFKAIEQVLSAEVRPVLQQNGSEIEMEDFRLEGETPVVTIALRGGCMGVGAEIRNCIQAVLRNRLNPAFRVEAAGL